MSRPWIAATFSGFVIGVASLFVFSVGVRAETITIGGTGWSIGMARQLASVYTEKHPDIRIQVPDSVGSGGGVKAVLNGRFDLSFASRPIKKKNQGKGLVETPYIRTPFVLSVSPKAGKDTAMTTDELMATYKGELTHWKNGTPINHVIRSERESSTTLMAAHFAGIGPLISKKRKSRGALYARNDQEAMDIGEKIVGVIVPMALLAIRAEQRALEPITIDGIHPTLANLEAGKWVMETTLYLVQGPKLTAAARAFLSFLRSEEAARILLRHGGTLLK